MKIDVYNQKGEKTGETLLPKEIFDVKLSQDLMHQVVVSQMSNRRQVIAHTKGRGEVSGGGKKPWAQKGTGRARHGSIRSPLWKGGGTTFGPTKEANFKKKIPSQMKRRALFMALSEKFRNNLLVVVDVLNIENPKTKVFVEILKKLPLKNQSRLIALSGMDRNLILAARNISSTKTIQATDLNVFDLLSFKYLVLPKESIKVIQKTFIEKEIKEDIQEEPKKRETKKVAKKAVKTRKKKK
jgi:large subunit ribosomal protein L4